MSRKCAFIKLKSLEGARVGSVGIFKALGSYPVTQNSNKQEKENNQKESH